MCAECGNRLFGKVKKKNGLKQVINVGSWKVRVKNGELEMFAVL
jgi:DNA-directed RNA polymerase subunit RPC12/RpoP